MKVVMTVDIPIEDYTELSELNFLANINIFPGVTSTMYHYDFENVVVRPLPKKWKGRLSSLHPLSIHAQGMRDGYNMCLEELEETE